MTSDQKEKILKLNENNYSFLNEKYDSLLDHFIIAGARIVIYLHCLNDDIVRKIIDNPIDMAYFASKFIYKELDIKGEKLSTRLFFYHSNPVYDSLFTHSQIII